MSTPTIYDTTVAALQQYLPTILESQRTNLALMIAGIMQAQSSHLADIARVFPIDTQQASKEQRIRRTLDNDRITRESHYYPLVAAYLRQSMSQTVDICLDRVILNDRFNVLVASCGLRRRAIPLAWRVLNHQGSSSWEDQTTVLTEIGTYIPQATTVTIHADAEFRSTELFRWIRSQGWHAILGISSHTYVHLPNDEIPDKQTVSDLYGQRTQPLFLSQVAVTQNRFGPVNLIIWREKDTDGEERIRAVMTDHPADGRTFRHGRWRMWTENEFRDWQSYGFQLQKTGLVHATRLERRLIMVGIAYLMLIGLGRWVVKRGYRRMIDDGPRRRWQYSVFQLGVGWMRRCQSKGIPVPIILVLYD